jgi:cyclic pyranopterin phosphate synthase
MNRKKKKKNKKKKIVSNTELKDEEKATHSELDLHPEQQEREVQELLIDSFGRIAKKLRISVTDRCNMQCMYCMPQGKVQWFREEDVLNYDEITRFVSIMADLGIEKIRLTGGEPLLRPKLENLISSLNMIRGVKSISMTTNGLLLADKVKQLKDAGLESVNISLDSFRADRFRTITGTDNFKKVIDAVEAADNAGLRVKINTVIIRGWNDDEIVDFATFARNTGHVVRFIEFMPLDGSGIWQPDLVYSKKEMIELIVRSIERITPLTDGDGSSNHENGSNGIYNRDPAVLYSFTDGKGIIGFIPSITEPFCGNCDRIRITSDGRLLTCLFEKPGYDIRAMIRGGKSDQYIKRQLLEDIRRKPEGIIKLIKTRTLRPSLNLMHTIGG